MKDDLEAYFHLVRKGICTEAQQGASVRETSVTANS